jgi:hypothetical protein
MNNGGKAEKENTPNEANLQEEEVRTGSVRWRARPGSEVRAPNRRGAGPRGAAITVWGLPWPPRLSGQNGGPGTVSLGACVFFLGGGPRVSACLTLRNFEDFLVTFVTTVLSFVCPGFKKRNKS